MPREKYGNLWPDTTSDLHIELFCFREDTGPMYGITPEQRPFHFKNICRLFWGKDSKKPFIWNPWADKMLIAACTEKYLGLSGCASSGKTSFSAIWGLVNWLALPTKTIVVVTSTSLEDARRRIWGEMEAYFNAANESLKPMKVQLPGKIVGSLGKIRGQEGDKKFDDKCGINLIAGDRAKEKENVGKLIGLKNSRVFLIADELPELSPSLVSAAKSNLMANPFFQMVGIGNFKSIHDSFGTFCEPEGGWVSVSPDFEQWRMRDGLCLRFDGSKSPNVLLGEQRFPGMYGPSHLKEHREAFGENSPEFWRMCKSYPCPSADPDRIYSDADILKGDAKGFVRWSNKPIKFAILDPAWANDGDKAAAKVGLLGISEAGIQTMQFTKHVDIREDVRKKDESRVHQVARGFMELCEAEGVPPENAALDISGGGLPFGALLSEIWKTNKFLGVQFGGAPSMRAASLKDRRPAKDAFFNRVAELWFSGVEFMASGQIKGLNAQTCVELTERRKLPAMKAGNGIKLRIETKKDMKLRTNGKSPDEADCALIGLELCRERFGFKAVGRAGNAQAPLNTFKQNVRAANKVFANVSYQPEEQAA